MASPTQSTPTHGRIKLGSAPILSTEPIPTTEPIKDPKRTSTDNVVQFYGDQPHSPSLLRLVHEKNLQHHVTPETPQIRHTSGGTKATGVDLLFLGARFWIWPPFARFADIIITFT
jgi:hypothetical protein